MDGRSLIHSYLDHIADLTAMRTSSMIGGAALAVFTVLIVISFASMYDSTYASVGSVQAQSEKVVFTDQSLFLIASMSANNSGHFTELVSVLNKTFKIAPGKSNITDFSIPLNLTKLYSGEWPLKNASVSMNILVQAASILLKASRGLNLSVDVGAPFGGFSVSNLTETVFGNAHDNLSVSFTDLFAQFLNITKIAVFNGSKNIGNLTLPDLEFGKSYSVQGKVNLSGSSPSVNLSFRAGPFHWSLNNITVNSSK